MSQLESEVKEVKTLLQDVNAKLQDSKNNSSELNARMMAMEQLVVNMETKGGGMPVQSAGNQGGILSGIVSANGQNLRVLSKGQPLAKGGFNSGADDEFTLSNYVRSQFGFERPKTAVVTSNSGLVPVSVSDIIIDMAREVSAVAAAGSLVIEIDGPTNLGRVDGDPTVYVHEEGISDIEDSSPIFSGVSLNPKSLVCNIPLSAEVVADSANLDSLLKASIAGAFASKLDGLCLAKILADDNVPGSGSNDQNPAYWRSVLQAVGSGLALKQSLPTALISNPADLISRASELPAGAWLGKPELLKDMLELHAAGLPVGTAIMGKWEEAFAIAFRSQLTLELVRYQKPGAFTHLLVCSLRADGYVMQPGKLYVQQGNDVASY